MAGKVASKLFSSGPVIGALSLAALAVAGCTTAEPGYSTSAGDYGGETYGPPIRTAGNYPSDYAPNYTGPDRLYRNGYVENTRPREGHAAPMTEAGVLAAYEGIDGARLAHRIYGEAQAERLDGACEPFVKVTQGENLYDVSQYCDVPINMLVDSNPAVRNPRHVAFGQIIEVPQLYNAERHAVSMGAGEQGVVFASWYVVQPGDTLNDIAARHLVSSTSLANLNPGVSWQYLPVGAQIRLPAAGDSAASLPVGVAAPVAYPVANGAITGSLPYPYPAAGTSDGSTVVATSTGGGLSLAPYQLTPAQKAAEKAGKRNSLLSVDRQLAYPGDEVLISASGLPANASVSLYRGANGRELEYVRTVRTDSAGGFAEPVRVRRSSDLGGVIFRATVDDSGEDFTSPRVGVNKLDDEDEGYYDDHDEF